MLQIEVVIPFSPLFICKFFYSPFQGYTFIMLIARQLL